MIKNIIFDIGGVLINYYPMEYLKQLNFEKDKLEGICDSIFKDTLWNDLDKGIYKDPLDCLDVFQKKHPEYKDELEIFYNSKWKENVYKPIESSMPLFKYAKEKYKIYILSNFHYEGYKYLIKEYDFIKNVDGQVISCDVQMIKPNKDIYLELLNKYNLKAEECIFFDDKKENIDTANSLGIHGYQFINPKDAMKVL